MAGAPRTVAGQVIHHQPLLQASAEAPVQASHLVAGERRRSFVQAAGFGVVAEPNGDELDLDRVPGGTASPGGHPFRRSGSSGEDVQFPRSLGRRSRSASSRRLGAASRCWSAGFCGFELQMKPQISRFIKEQLLLLKAFEPTDSFAARAMNHFFTCPRQLELGRCRSSHRSQSTPWACLQQQEEPMNSTARDDFLASPVSPRIENGRVDQRRPLDKLSHAVHRRQLSEQGVSAYQSGFVPARAWCARRARLTEATQPSHVSQAAHSSTASAAILAD